MSKTEIEWCKRPGTKPETWNPTTGCNKVSQGCKNCYAEVMHKRLQVMYPKKYGKPFLEGVVEHDDALMIPMKWNTPRTVFVNSMSDLFHDDVSYAFIFNVFVVMAMNPQHTFQVLTKRPGRMATIINSINGNTVHACADANLMRTVAAQLKKFVWPLPNVWLGTSCEDQQTANERIPLLLQVPAAVRFLSCEPLLGKIDFKEVNFKTVEHVDKWGIPPLTGIDWVIAGGESGHGARPMHPDWVRSLRDQCQAADVSFFFKQWGVWYPEFVEMSEWDEGTGLMPGGKSYVFSEKESAINRKVIMTKMGKKVSGRLLDKREWNEWTEG